MADRFWVGGTGTWDSSSTTHWSATDGGAGGASAPTSSDNVFFTTLSNATAYNVTTGAGATCADLTFAAPASGNVTWTSAAATSIAGSMTLYVGLIYTGAAALNFTSTTTGKTITTAGCLFGNGTPITFNGVGGAWTLSDNFSNVNLGGGTNSISMTNGTLNTAGFTVATNLFNSGVGTSVLNLGASAINLTRGSSGNTANFTASTTINAGTSTFTISYAGFGGLSGNITFASHTLYNVTISNSTGYAEFQLGGNFTVSNAFTVNGANANTTRLYLSSTIAGTTRTITCNGSFGVSANVDFEDITIAGSAGSLSGTSFGNAGGCTGVTFTSPVTRFWVGGTGNLCGTGNWSATSGGASGASFPLPQDTITFDASSVTSGAQTITSNVTNLRIPSLDLTNVLNTPTLALGSAGLYVYGSLILLGIGTLSGTTSGIVTFRGRSSYTLNPNGKTFLAQVDLKASGGTLGLAGALVCNFQVRMFQGTLQSNDFAITAFALTLNTGSQGSVDGITLGTSLITLTGTGTVYSGGSAASVISAASATFKITDTSATQKNFTTSGNNTTKTFGKIWITGASTGIVQIDQTGNVQQNIGELQVDNPPRTIQFGGASNRSYAIGLFTLTGTPGNLITIQANAPGNSYILINSSTRPFSTDYISLRDCFGRPGNTTTLGGYKWFFGTHSTNVSGNRGVVFAAPGANYPTELKVG